MRTKEIGSDLFWMVLIVFLISNIAILIPTAAVAGWADDVKSILLGTQSLGNQSDFEEIYEEEGDVTDEGLHPLTAPGRIHRPQEGTAARLFYDRMVYIMGNLRDTKYVHHEDSVMDEDEGVYRYDCSGFVGGFILQKALPAHYQDLFDNARRFHSGDADSRPRAWGFYDYFREILGEEDENQNTYWYVFKSIQKIQPGDIIVVKYDEDWQRSMSEDHHCQSVSTGHVMVAWSFPVISECADNERWIYVIDSSSSGHAEDTRRTTYDDVNDEKGIGKGKMWYGINDNKRPVYYRWSKSSCENGCKYTLTTMNTNCDGDKYCPCSGCDLNHKYYERLQGILMARPIFSQ